MSTPPATVSLLTDTGPASELPGVLESIVRDLAPHATVIHIGHQIAPHDVRGGSLVLARAIGYLPSGVVLAAVDPGTDRPYVAIEVGGGSGVLIGPDNGLLAPAVALAGGADRAVVLDDPTWHLASAGAVLPARDVLAPVAAALCNGTPLELLGTEVDTSALLPGVVPIAREADGRIEAEVLWVDGYGNVQLNVSPDDLDSLGEIVAVGFGSTVRSAVRRTSVVGLGDSQLALVPDPYGLVALGLNRRPAAVELGLGVGDAVSLYEPDGQQGGTITAVQLRR